MSLIFTPCFLSFKYECAKVTVSSNKPYEKGFVKSKSWGLQSKALERSIKTVPTKFLLFRIFLVPYKSKQDIIWTVWFFVNWY